MRAAILPALLIGLCSLLSGCCGSLELVGYGPSVQDQRGLVAQLLCRDTPLAAEIQVTNTTGVVVSINQSPMAMGVRLIRDGQEVAPVGRIMHKLSSTPGPDDFAILAPGQTRIIPVPLSFKDGRFQSFSSVYDLDRGALYDVEVELVPYSGAFTAENADAWLERFRIPNYFRGTLKLNALMLRRKAFWPWPCRWRSTPPRASFRLRHPETGEPLRQVVVSVHDGFDRKLPPFSGQPATMDEPFHIADVTTSREGSFELDLGRLEAKTLFLTVKGFHGIRGMYKFIEHKGSVVTIRKYLPEGNSLHVVARHDYDLSTGLVSELRYPGSLVTAAKAFSVIDVPMDR